MAAVAPLASTATPRLAAFDTLPPEILLSIFRCLTRELVPRLSGSAYKYEEEGDGLENQARILQRDSVYFRHLSRDCRRVAALPALLMSVKHMEICADILEADGEFGRAAKRFDVVKGDALPGVSSSVVAAFTRVLQSLPQLVQLRLYDHTLVVGMGDPLPRFCAQYEPLELVLERTGEVNPQESTVFPSVGRACRRLVQLTTLAVQDNELEDLADYLESDKEYGAQVTELDVYGNQPSMLRSPPVADFQRVLHALPRLDHLHLDESWLLWSSGDVLTHFYAGGRALRRLDLWGEGEVGETQLDYASFAPYVPLAAVDRN